MGHTHGASLWTNFDNQLFKLQAAQIWLNFWIYGRLFRSWRVPVHARLANIRADWSPTQAHIPVVLGQLYPQLLKHKDMCRARTATVPPFLWKAAGARVKGSFILTAAGFKGASGAPAGLLSCARSLGPAGRSARPP